MTRMLRLALFASIFAAIAWWLFRDTVRHHGIGSEKSAVRISYWGDYIPYLMWQEMFGTFEEAQRALRLGDQLLGGRRIRARPW